MINEKEMEQENGVKQPCLVWIYLEYNHKGTLHSIKNKLKSLSQFRIYWACFFIFFFCGI